MAAESKKAIDFFASKTAKYTPKLVSKGLGGVERIGLAAAGLVNNNRLAKWMGNKIDGMAAKKSTGPVQSFFAAGILGGKSIKEKLADLNGVSQLMFIIIILICVVMWWWCQNKLSLNKTNCTKLEEIYKNFPIITNIDVSVLTINDKLRDYYIMTAYNCCVSGNYKNDFVNICALKSCIKQGARCLDFEIYSVKGKPSIACSSISNYSIKESYNVLDFSEAMNVISGYAFSTITCPNPEDPLILHFRIMTNDKTILDKMAVALYNTLGQRLLNKTFSYEFGGQNIGQYALGGLMGKVLIIIDKTNKLYLDSTINEYVNLTSNSVFMRSLRYKDVEFGPDKDELIEFNRTNMTIVLPDHTSRNNNYSSALVMTYGCQMIGMAFQRYDGNMQFYMNKFAMAGSAFIQRPTYYLYYPEFIPIPKPQDPCNASHTDETYISPNSRMKSNVVNMCQSRRVKPSFGT